MTHLPDELEEKLFVAMLEFQRKGAGPVFDLEAVCRDKGIAASKEQMLAFVVDNDGTFGSKRNTTHSKIRFEISAEGIRHARAIEKDRKPLTLANWIRGLPLGKGAWDLIKIGFGVFLGVVATSYFGK